MATFQEYCDRCSNEVEHAIIAWHGRKYISPAQAKALLRYNYPLGGFYIDDTLLSLLISMSIIPTGHKRIEINRRDGANVLLRDATCLRGFYSSYEYKFEKCEISERETVLTMMKEDLLEYCMNIIRNTCEFGG